MSALSILHGCATIQLTKGQNTLVDEQWFDLIDSYKWFATLCYDSFYAARHEREGLKQHRIYIHRFIWSLENTSLPAKAQMDHRNRDALDNRIENLRIAIHGQNNCNARKKEWRGQTSSRFKGVSWSKRRQCWRVVITKDQKQRELGQFATDIEVARAYNSAAIELFGEFARINEIPDSSDLPDTLT